jgi:hypothetical protein
MLKKGNFAYESYDFVSIGSEIWKKEIFSIPPFEEQENQYVQRKL